MKNSIVALFIVLFSFILMPFQLQAEKGTISTSPQLPVGTGLPYLEKITWDASKIDGKKETTVDPNQLKDIVLGKLEYVDSVDLELITNPPSCQGSVFRESGQRSYTHKLGDVGNYGRTLLPVVLKSCRGTSYTLKVVANPRQIDLTIPARKKTSDILTVTGPMLSEPKILLSNLSSEQGGGKKTYLAGEELVLNFEVVGADEVFIESHTGNKKFNSLGDLKGRHTKSTFSFKAGSSVSGFDLIAQTSHEGKVKKDEKRFLPDIIRRVNLTVPLQWKNVNQLPGRMKITCAIGGSRSVNQFWKAKTISPGKDSKLQLSLEDIVRSSANIIAKLYYYCIAKDHSDTAFSYGYIEEPISYTYSTWPVKELSITTKTFVLDGK